MGKILSMGTAQPEQTWKEVGVKGQLEVGPVLII